MTPPELEEIHQAYHDTQPTAPALNDDTSSLPPYEKATSLYPSLSKTTLLFVVMDGIGQEEVTPNPSFVIETDEEEDVITVQPKSVGPASRTRSKQTKALKKAIPQLTKNLKQFSSMLEGVPRMSGAVSSGPITSSLFLQPTPPLKKTPPTEKPRLNLFVDSLPEDLDDLSSFSDPPMRVSPFKEPNQNRISLREYSEYLAALPPFSKGTTVTKWINRILQMIPHGDGSTPHDRLLCNN